MRTVVVIGVVASAVAAAVAPHRQAVMVQPDARPMLLFTASKTDDPYVRLCRAHLKPSDPSVSPETLEGYIQQCADYLRAHGMPASHQPKGDAI